MWKLSIDAASALIAQLSGALGLLIATPIFLNFLGKEAYGLIGVLATVQSLIVLLDLGVATSLMRATSSFKEKGDTARFHAIFRLVLLFAAAGFCAILIAGFGGANAVATIWLSVEDLPSTTVQTCLVAIFVQLGFRWIIGFLRANALGMEWVVTASAVQVLGNVLRYGLGAALLVWPGLSLSTFFWFQASCSVVELLCILFVVRKNLPHPLFARVEVRNLKSELYLTGTLSAALVLWSVASQADRVILSNMLPLGEFGEFMLGITIASGVLILAGPFGGVLIPRFTSLSEANESEALHTTFLAALTAASVFAGAVAVTLGFFMEDVFYIWLDAGPKQYADVITTASWYSLGNLALVLGSVPYYLQVAKGNLHYHLIGAAFSTAGLLISLPVLIHFRGIEGAGMAWMLVNTSALCWSLWVAKRLLPSLQHRDWLRAVILPISGILVTTFTFKHVITLPQDRIGALITLLTAGLAIVITGIISSPLLARFFRETFFRGS
ncbi:oligosaccharide flippase family protein [Congregibacter brevis]|uniref:Oligosaccharide flippase family protein n=1 Tax=Congregibacter brevis TaxID=3081201 RepID=A0ABZ0IB96_9GAMM|nr:oligosaccharide flippase family protein [Congregibacter sp. IMCC45268]